MAKGGKKEGTAKTHDSSAQEIQALLDKIDGLDVLDGRSKAAKLSDVEGEITNLEASLIGMRRALVQYKKPNARVDQQGNTLSGTIEDTVRQLTRLREYRKEIQALPDDPEDAEVESDDKNEETNDE